MTLREQQSKFVWMVTKLLTYAHSLGFEVTFGHAERCTDCKTGHYNSLHKKRLAIDLNLFIDGEYQTGSRGHDTLHHFWESIGGAPMIRNDANHYSVEWDGMR